MILPRWSKFFGAVPVVLALAGLAGCEKPNADDETTEVATSELSGEPAPAKPTKAGPARGDHRHAPRGPAMLIGAALHELDLTDAQKATIQAELDALHETAEARPDHDAERAALAAAVKSGQIDEGALLARLTPKAPDTTRLAKAIGVLHDTLTADQRKELVASVQKRMERGPRGERGPGMPHDDADEARGPRDGQDRDDARSSGKRGRGEHGPGMRGPGEHGPLGHMLRGVSLSDAQREKVKDALSKLAPSEGDREAMKAQHEAFRSKMAERLATFAEGSFDASAFVAPPDGAAKFGPEKMFGHMVKALAAVVPILDDAQRAELAKRIEEGPGAPSGMGKHGKGRSN